MGTPKISILVPTYNPVPEHLREALECLRSQTMREWHAVIHDDCSTVDVLAIVEPFLTDTRFTFVRSDCRLGIGGNWNACLTYATAPVIQYLFQDDLWSPMFLEKGLAILETHPSVGFVSIDHEYRYENGRNNAAYYDELNAFKRMKIAAGEHRGGEMLRQWLAFDLKPGLIGEPSFVMIRRSLTEKIGPFLTDMPQSLDNEYWIRALLSSDWYFLKESLGEFRVHAAAASAMNDLAGAGLADRLRIYQLLLKQLPRKSDLHATTQTSLIRALSAMVRRFFQRRKQGKSVAMRGGSKKTILLFVLRHPLIFLNSLRRK
ncbi:MAG: glycosyltransferase family 2 protein [Candidatus Peribacteraceae bacterium]|nr:glycosyltransferase family 2 protein [Candidatus Peribacteraceae bacterium]MDD5074513.1 glycosyltransferase family 2 protein [Candidatus Peribacteraceae bacterium]